MLDTIETSDIDLYSDESLLNPFDNYQKLRNAGPLVYLKKHDMYVASRFRDVKEILSRPDIFISGNGVMMNEAVNDVFKGGIGLCTDGDAHRRIRKVEARPLNPRALRELRDVITSEAEELADKLVSAGRFNAATDLAQALPLSIVSNLVGLPEQGRERMLVWAAANFDSFGPPTDRTASSMGVFEEMVEYAMTQCVRGKLKPGGWAEMLHDAADAGEITDQEAHLMALSYVAPSLDTTIFATSSAIWLFSKNPDQWDKLRENPSLIPNAINEVIRIESPIQGFSRYATEDFELDGTVIPKDSRVIILFGSANRDERRWEDPTRFDITRERVSDQLGFGFGEHVCIGNNLARMEIAAIFTALIKNVSRFELHDSKRLLNSTLRGFSNLDISVH